MRTACRAVVLQTGQAEFPDCEILSPQSMQNMLWPQGTSTAVTSLSPQTMQSRLPETDSVGEVLWGGEGRDVGGNDHMLEGAVAVSKEGESPIPSSRSIDVLQMDPKSLVVPQAEDAEDAELHPELLVNADVSTPLSPVMVLLVLSVVRRLSM